MFLQEQAREQRDKRLQDLNHRIRIEKEAAAGRPSTEKAQTRHPPAKKAAARLPPPPRRRVVRAAEELEEALDKASAQPLGAALPAVGRPDLGGGAGLVHTQEETQVRACTHPRFGS